MGRSFGTIDALPSGRYRARYAGPDGNRHTAPHTFDTKGDARAWLTLRHADIITARWKPSSEQGQTFGEYAAVWLAQRRLARRTREHYDALLAGHLAPLRPVLLRKVTPQIVSAWFGELDTGPTMRAHAYSLLRTIMNSAVAHDLIVASPCRIRGAGKSPKAKHNVPPATLDELATIVAAMPEQYRALTLIAAWNALRFGEAIALRRRDITAGGTVVRVRRGVVRVKGEGQIEGATKTESSVRDVAVPPHIVPVLVEHQRRHTGPGNALLFPGPRGGFLAPETLYRWFHPAREAAGRPDLHWHDLRGTGATLAAATGATLRELMSRLGHSTPAAALLYQKVAAGRDTEIARLLSDLAATHSNSS